MDVSFALTDPENIKTRSRRASDPTNAAAPRHEESAGFRFFDRSAHTDDLAGNLPHWRQTEVVYFVTFRLTDALPAEKTRSWNAERARWLADHPEPRTPMLEAEFHRRFTARMNAWLDAGHGSCVLRDPQARTIVEDTLRRFDGPRYRLGGHVVMPNHVHALVAPAAGHALSGILHTWKSFTAHEINGLLGRTGPLWQKESFDHIVRSPGQLERIEEYIRLNPTGGRPPK